MNMAATHSPSSPHTDQAPSINHLPAELKLNSFELSSAKPFLGTSNLFGISITFAALFVLCLWSAIVASTPELWKIVFGFVDILGYWRKTGNQIQLSQDLPLTLVRARYDTASAYDLEGIHVQILLDSGLLED